MVYPPIIECTTHCRFKRFLGIPFRLKWKLVTNKEEPWTRREAESIKSTPPESKVMSIRLLPLQKMNLDRPIKLTTELYKSWWDGFMIAHNPAKESKCWCTIVDTSKGSRHKIQIRSCWEISSMLIFSLALIVPSPNYLSFCITWTIWVSLSSTLGNSLFSPSLNFLSSSIMSSNRVLMSPPLKNFYKFHLTRSWSLSCLQFPGTCGKSYHYPIKLLLVCQRWCARHGVGGEGLICRAESPPISAMSDVQATLALTFSKR